MRNSIIFVLKLIVIVISIILISTVTIGIIYIFSYKSYENDYTKNHYSIVIVNETKGEIETVELLVNGINNSDIPMIIDDHISSGEYRKLSLNIKDEKLIQIPWRSYNVIIKFNISGEEYFIPAGYFTSEWGCFRVIIIRNIDGKYMFDYKNNNRDRMYKKLLKRHYYDPYEVSWFE